jgi:putative ABC transport system permease protein
MLRNYLKIALRNLLHNKAFSLINIIGLAVSMSVCLLIINLIADQKSYDQFHVNKDRIYRVMTHGKNGNDFQTATSALPLGQKLKKEFTGIERTASLVRNIGGDVVYDEKFASGGGYFADGELFKILDFKLSKGDANTALKNPFSLVISEEIALQLFGNQEAIGKIVKFNDKGISPGTPEKGNRETEYGTFTITGVLAKNVGKTHLPFKLLASLSTLPMLANDKKVEVNYNEWDNIWNSYTYVLMEKNKSQEDLQAALNQISDKQYPKGQFNQNAFEAKALMKITPSNPIGNETHIAMPEIVLIILSILGLIVMLSACLNYTNLSIARSLTRAKEVGLRKVVGASRKQIFTQFISEAIVVSLLSLVLAIGFLEVLKFAFEGLWLNKFLNIAFDQNLSLFLVFIVFSLIIGFVAGVLPSFYISIYNPIQMLRNFGNIKLFKRLTLRKVLLVTQFCVSLIFIISTALLHSQTNHLLSFDYGFDKNNIVDINLYKPENYQRFAQAIASNRDVTGVSACSFMPSTGVQNSTKSYKPDKKDSIQTNYLDIDSRFLNVWDIKLVAGKNLPELPSSTSENYVLINETMVKDFKYGSPNAAVGQKVIIDGNNVEILGVVKDFQFLDVTQKMGPLALRNRPNTFGFANVKISGRNTAETLAYLEKTWKTVNPNTKFEYEFLDQQLFFVHSMLGDVARILSVLSFLAVLISCLGLLGMATYTAETRTKEIGVRKVLGSSVWQIVVLLSKGYLKMLLIAIVIATPLAYLLNNLWLDFFTYRVSIGFEILSLSIFILLIISVVTVFSQSWRAARVSPIKSLRTE